MPKKPTIPPAPPSLDDPVPPYEGPNPELRARAAMNAMLQEREATGEVTLSNGIVIGAKRVPTTIMRRLMAKLPEPKVPMVMITDNGREEPNHTDPQYLEELEACYNARIQAASDVYLGLGTFVVSVPDDRYPVDDERWILNLSRLGVEPNLETPESRYLEWLTLYALEDSNDYMKLIVAASMKTGIIEQEVADATAYFRDNPRWRANRNLPAL